MVEQAFSKKIRNENFEVNLSKLDASQRAAVESVEENVVIRASAGSGKTSTLITAIAAYRYENINDRICAITYTRAAKDEMVERLQSMGIYDVEVSTIHVWSRNMLEQLALKYDFKIRLMEAPDIKTILEEITSEYRLRRGNKMRINIDILYSYITGNKNMDITDGYKRTLNALEELYIEYKRDNNLYDFTDLPLYLYDVMVAYNEFVYDVDALFVDEFQDVDEVQFETFRRVLTKKKFFIGDGWQSIYVFRGADGEVFDKLNDFDLYKLKYNYRSYQEIIDYAATVYQNLKYRADIKDSYIAQIDYSDPCSIHCSRGYGGSVTVFDAFGNCNKIENMVNLKVGINEQQNLFNSFVSKNPMILCRTNKQVKAIQEFGYTNVSTVHQAKGLEYDNVIVIDTAIKNLEDLNIAYVALTRARDEVMVMGWNTFEAKWRSKNNLWFL